MTTERDNTWQILDDVLMLLASHHFPTPERTYKLDGGWPLALSDLNRLISQLTAELAEARAALSGRTVSCVCGNRDTARLDWAIAKPDSFYRSIIHLSDGENPRAAIDAAMEPK